MRVLCFTPVDLKIGNYEVTYCSDEDDFYNKIIYKKYDVVIVAFEYYGYFLEIKNFVNSYVIFITDYCSAEYYKKILQTGDYCYEYSALNKLYIRLDYLYKKILNNSSKVYKFGEFLYNFNTNELYKNSYPVKLSGAEKELLKTLIKNRNNYISKEDIIMNCDSIESESSIKVLISHLRKLGIEIENRKNLGYRLKG